MLAERVAARRHYTPDACDLRRYRQAADILGISRAIVVQPSVYAFDNRLLLEELRDNDADYRGVAVVERDIDDATLDAMHALGVRGVRANVVNSNGLSAADALARSNPARLLWATDWPHPGLGTAPMPDDADAVDLLEQWLPEETLRRQALVDNPTALYRA